ncbi:MAG TPA: hypothetical protein VLD57_09325 [Blastocatellia bacterium]|nr:hypothetical protein [Blastocatellia bacterium]
MVLCDLCGESPRRGWGRDEGSKQVVRGVEITWLWDQEISIRLLNPRATFISQWVPGVNNFKLKLIDPLAGRFPVFSEDALSKILTEADRIVCDAQGLLDKAIATGQDDLVEAALHNLNLVMENRNRLNRVFALRLAASKLEA